MRDIKFRAWDKHNSEMVYSDKESSFYIDTKGALFMYCTQNTEELYYCDYALMQYTGLNDNNGSDIYEGDIVKWAHIEGDLVKGAHIEGGIELSGVRVAVVGMSPALQLEAFKPRKTTFEWGSFMYAGSTDKYLEVIGNIHQNPELLAA